MDFLGLLGAICVAAGVYFLIVPNAIVVGVVCVLVGLFLLGYLGNSRRGTRL